MKKILLVQPLHEKQKKTQRSSFNFPWGIAYIARYLLNDGYQVEVIDGHAMQLEKEEIVQQILDTKCDILGISAFSTQYNAVRVISKAVKESLGIKVIVGGPLSHYSYKLTLDTTDVDFCVIGEGEMTVVDLLRNINSPEKVKGIAYRNNGQVIVTQPRSPINNLDDLPKPAYELFQMERYVNIEMSMAHMKYRKGLRIMTFVSQRGCPFRCNFCSKSTGGFRLMSVDKLIETLRYLKEQYKLDGIHFNDELFVSNKKRMLDFAPRIKELQLIWDGQARVNFVDYELLSILKDAGCVGIGLGIESGSQKILDNMKKGITVKQIESAMLTARKLGMYVKVQLIFGYPGEDEKTIQETIDLFKKVNHPGRRFNVIVPLPGSPLYDEAIQKGLIKDEVEYLIGLEKSFGVGKVHINFTNFPDDKIYQLKLAAERKIKRNYLIRNPHVAIKKLKKRFMYKLKKVTF